MKTPLQTTKDALELLLDAVTLNHIAEVYTEDMVTMKDLLGAMSPGTLIARTKETYARYIAMAESVKGNRSDNDVVTPVMARQLVLGTLPLIAEALGEKLVLEPQ